jgi:hypothetical protein
MLSGRVLSSDFLVYYWSAGSGRFPQVSAIAFHWLEDCANFMPTPEDTTNTSPTTLKAIQAVSQTTLLKHNYTPLVISRNSKNKQLTIIMPI